MQGFIVFDYVEKYAAGKKQLAEWLSEGKLRRKETIIKGGLKAAEEGLLQLFKGQNIGKLPSSPIRNDRLFVIFD